MFMKKLLLGCAVIGTGIALITLIISALSLFCLYQSPGLIVFHTMPKLDSKLADPSYLLLTPFVQNQHIIGGQVYLTDLYGKLVHQWKIKNNPVYAELQPNGHLLVEENNDPYPDHLVVLEEFDWSGKIVNSYTATTGKPVPHHQSVILPNGNFAFLASQDLTSTQSALIQGGQPAPAGSSSAMTKDIIAEVNKEGETVWSWDTATHLDFAKFPISMVDNRREWTHANSLEYLPHNPIDLTEGFLVSFRNISTVAIIRKSDGALLWTSPADFSDHQHDATLLSSGNILIFNNGANNRNAPGSIVLGSQVKEIDPRSNKVVWSWENGNIGTFERAEFESSIIGGAQRLENGNTMIVDGLHAHLFEVTPDKKVVWDLENPFQSEPATGIFLNNSIFKARRYRASEIANPQELPSPTPSSGQVCSSAYSWISSFLTKVVKY